MSLTIGADPEFALLDSGGEIVKADVAMERGNGKEGAVGIDPSGTPAEIRPTHAKDPLTLVENIRSTLKDLIKSYTYLKALKWASGAYSKWPLGGHIHFGAKFPKGEDDVISPLAKEFAIFVSSFAAYPLALCDKEGFMKRRHPWPEQGDRTGYGRTLDDCRQPVHGTEVRAFSSWLSTPDIAKAVLCTAYVAASSFDKRQSRPTAALAAVTSAWEELDDSALAEVQKAVKRMDGYSDYKEHIDKLLQLDCKPVSIDMKETWGLVKFIKPVIRIKIGRPQNV